MVKKTPVGVWVAIGLSVIIAFIVSLSRSLNVGSFLVVYALSCIVLYIIYWVITKVYPKSQNWGVILWVIAIVGTSIIIIFVLAFVAGMAGSGSNINQQTNQPLSLISLQPTPTSGSTADALNNEAIATSQAIDSANPIVKNFATTLVNKINGGPYRKYGVNQISDIWDAIYHQWTYVSDPPTFNYYTSASDSINNSLKGNCEDFAILNAAVTESIGGDSRVVTAHNTGGVGHAYAEQYISNNYLDLQSTTDYLGNRYGVTTVYYHKYVDSQGTTGYWLNLDWSANHPGGPFFQDDGTYNIFYPNGAYDVITNSGSTVVTSEVSNPTPTINVYTGNLYPTPTQTLVVPSISIYPIIIVNKLANIPYKSYQGYYFNGDAGDIFHISIGTSAPTDVLLMNQMNYNIYQNAFKSNSMVSFNAVTYRSVTSSNFNYYSPSQDTYYVVIENYPFITGGADSKTSVIASTEISLTGHS